MLRYFRGPKKLKDSFGSRQMEEVRTIFRSKSFCRYSGCRTGVKYCL